MTRDIVFVHGTWSRSALWHQPHSDVTHEAEGWGFRVHQFKWSGILGGVEAPLHPALLPEGDPDEATNGADEPELLLWLDAGEKLVEFCRARGLERPHVLSHSHGRQVTIYALAKGQAFDTIVDISGPVRRDLERARRIGLSNVHRWVHYYDPVNDLTIREGQLFDGKVSGGLTDSHARENIDTSGSGHTGLLLDRELRARYKLWEQFGPEGAATL